MARCCHWSKVIQGRFISRQTWLGLQRSVHTLKIACTFSCAVYAGLGWRVRLGLGLGLLEVVDEFLVFGSIFDGEFEFTFFGPEDDGLTFHAADHIEGSLGFTAQSHFQEVFFDTGFDGFAQDRGDLEVAVRRAKAFNALMGPLVVVVFNPEPDALTCRVEAFELSPGEELLPDGLPEALDFAEGHRVMRPGFEVVRAVLLHLGLEAGSAAPVNVLPAIIGEHLLGWLILSGRDAENLQHVLGRVAPEEVSADHEPGVIIHEANEIGVTATQPEGKDIGLPHLVRGSALKEARPDQIASRLGRRLH